jgi:transcription elongation factor GreB
VTYVNGRDEEITITIVGIDETNMENGRISWVSPVARALLKAQQGDAIEFRTPSGLDTLEVISIEYPYEDNDL